MKLVVDHARDPGYSRSPDGESRPALRVIQGGLARPSRLLPPSHPREPRAQEEPTGATLAPVDLNEVPIYLCPIPAWVPRLW